MTIRHPSDSVDILPYKTIQIYMDQQKNTTINGTKNNEYKGYLIVITDL